MPSGHKHRFGRFSTRLLFFIRRRSSASGSKDHRATLYCRQADSAAAGSLFIRICNTDSCCRRFVICCCPPRMDSVVRCDLQSDACPCGYKHPSQAKRVCSWRIWPSGGGALPRCRLHCPVSYCLAADFTFRQIIRCDWYYIAAGFT